MFSKGEGTKCNGSLILQLFRKWNRKSETCEQKTTAWKCLWEKMKKMKS